MREDQAPRRDRGGAAPRSCSESVSLWIYVSAIEAISKPMGSPRFLSTRARPGDARSPRHDRSGASWVRRGPQADLSGPQCSARACWRAARAAVKFAALSGVPGKDRASGKPRTASRRGGYERRTRLVPPFPQVLLACGRPRRRLEGSTALVGQADRPGTESQAGLSCGTAKVEVVEVEVK